MNKDIKHLILTRFNVASPGREQAIRLKPGWLEKRFQLFKDYCLPSVAYQTNKNFEWIIFFDEKTPAEYMEKIKSLQSVFPFRIEYTSLFDMSKICPQLVSERADTKWLLTSRLDTDDILAIDFIERLQNSLEPLESKVINFPNGLILSLTGKKPALYTDIDKSSPFVSLLEPFTDNIDTIWKKVHREVDEIAPMVQLGGAPAWLQIIHGDNIANRVRGVRVRIAAYNNKFPLLDKIKGTKEEAANDVYIENMLLTPVRYCRESARAVAKKILGRR